MSNMDLYNKTETIPWRVITQRRRLGHFLRLSDETPAKQALTEFLRKSKRPPGRPKTTWLSQIKQELSPFGIDPYDLNHVTVLANDREAWRATAAQRQCPPTESVPDDDDVVVAAAAAAGL